jgi:hypothetical protein
MGPKNLCLFISLVVVEQRLFWGKVNNTLILLNKTPKTAVREALKTPEYVVDKSGPSPIS